MDAIHNKHGGHTGASALIMKRFNEGVRDFLADSSRFDVASDNYITIETDPVVSPHYFM